MAARRGKSQARRNSGNGGLPGWAWALIGALVAVVLVLAVPKWLASNGDDFLRPQPNPDEQPAQASDDALPAPSVEDEGGDDEPEYDFYTLLPGKEVPVSDAELAAQERAEQAAAQQQAETDESLPQPVDTDSAARTAAPADDDASTRSVAADGSRYLLQAGSFQNPAQAEALKARIALLGLSARVVPATIEGRTVHRVQMGPYASATALADAKRKLESGGLPALAIKVK